MLKRNASIHEEYHETKFPTILKLKNTLVSNNTAESSLSEAVAV